jgi:hypothetical protein
MKRWIAIVMSCVPLLASAASFWDGNATLQRGDSSFESGLYAASNSFAPDTEIEVENLETGKTARVIVRERAGSQSSILVLLSPKAAEALDIAPGTIARVRVTIPVAARSGLTSVPEDQPSNPDPDFNPAAAFGPEIAAEAEIQPVETAETPLAETEPIEVAATEVEPETQPIEVAATEVAPETQPVEVAETLAPDIEPVETVVEAETVETPPAETEPAETASAETAANPEDERLLQDLAARRPQKQLFLPPREDEKFAYQESVEPPAETVEIAAQEAQPPEAPIQTAEQPAIESVEAAATSEPAAGAETALAEAQAPPEVMPELLDRISSAAKPTEKPTLLAAPEPLPAEQRPVAPAAAGEKAPSLALLAPEKTPDKVVVKPPEQKLAPSVPIAKAPPAVAKTVPYYVQLAAYSAESLASGLAASLSATYPVLVLAPPPAGKQIYRVMIGPLNKAESGTLLNWFRYRGFPDAFVKRE